MSLLCLKKVKIGSNFRVQNIPNCYFTIPYSAKIARSLHPSLLKKGKKVKMSPSLSPSSYWLLYGTLGCHLCDTAENLLKQAQTVTDFRYQKVDIIDLPEADMLKLADKIPVLVTPKHTLYYPFSLMDIMALQG